MSEITVKRSGAKRRSQMSRAQAKAAWGLSAPAIIIMFLFMILPFFMSVFYSFTDRRLVLNPNKPTKFVGWANYIKTFTNKTALQAFWNTFEYTIILVPVVLILATLLALLVNRKAKGVTFFRMIYFSPQVVTMTVVTVIWGFFFSSTADGLFNSILRVFGVPAQKWLQDTTLAMPSIAIMSIWQCVGMQMIIMLGGLQFIPGNCMRRARSTARTPGSSLSISPFRSSRIRWCTSLFPTRSTRSRCSRRCICSRRAARRARPQRWST